MTSSQRLPQGSVGLCTSAIPAPDRRPPPAARRPSGLLVPAIWDSSFTLDGLRAEQLPAGPETPPPERLASSHRTLCGTLTLAPRTLPGRPPRASFRGPNDQPNPAHPPAPSAHPPVALMLTPAPRLPMRCPRRSGGGAALARPRQARRGRKRHGAASARLSPSSPAARFRSRGRRRG